MAIIASDSFVRANAGTLGANWTTQTDSTDTGVIGITSNAAVPTASGNNSASYFSAATFPANQYAQCIVSGTGGATTHGGGPATRMSSGNYYQMFLNLNQSPALPQLQKLVGGTFSAIGTGTARGGSGSLARLESIRSVHTGYIDGVQVFQFSDSSLATGTAGICEFFGASTTVALNSWEAGDLIRGAGLNTFNVSWLGW